MYKGKFISLKKGSPHRALGGYRIIGILASIVLVFS